MSQNVYIDKEQKEIYIAEQGWMHADGRLTPYDITRIYNTYKTAKQYNKHGKIWRVKLEWELIDGGVNG